MTMKVNDQEEKVLDTEEMQDNIGSPDGARNFRANQDPGLANLDRSGGLLRHRQEQHRPSTPAQAREVDNQGFGKWDYGQKPGESTVGSQSYTGRGTGHGVRGR